MSAPPDKDSRTLAPTQKRIDDFRKRGEVALSRDLVSAITLLGGVIGLLTSVGSAGERLTRIMQRPLEQLDTASPMLVTKDALSFAVALVSPVVIGAIIACVVAMGVQLGWPPALRAPTFNLAKPFSFGGLGGLISPKAAIGRTLKSLAKLAFVGGAAAMALAAGWQRVAHGAPPSSSQLGLQIAGLCRALMLTAGAALLLLAAVDYIISKRDLMAKMRMTKQEMKREHKDSEGDPLIKGKRRRRMRELARRRLAQAVPTADVVLVNPTEYAVAIRYDATADRAPRVVAKGRGAVAERIREIARKAGIPIIAEPPLTRLIHKLVPEGKEIPGQLFAAVAEVLAYVYRLRGRNS
jgi:flagellar biosynthetic protein FlhB